MMLMMMMMIAMCFLFLFLFLVYFLVSCSCCCSYSMLYAMRRLSIRRLSMIEEVSLRDGREYCNMCVFVICVCRGVDSTSLSMHVLFVGV